MANPQKENGYTPIANELLEAICRASFTATQYKIVMLVARYTYGFNRKSHALSQTFVSNSVGCCVRIIKKDLKRLIEMRVIVEHSAPTFKSSREIGINKDYEQWANIHTGELQTPSTGELQTPSTGELQTPSTGELQTPQERKYLKQNLKKNGKKDLCAADAPQPKEKNLRMTVPPTLEMVEDYCAERNKGVDAQMFIDHYSARGWKYNGNIPMKDWQAAVRTWEKNGLSAGQSRASPSVLPHKETLGERNNRMIQEYLAKEGAGYDTAGIDVVAEYAFDQLPTAL